MSVPVGNWLFIALWSCFLGLWIRAYGAVGAFFFYGLTGAGLSVLCAEGRLRVVVAWLPALLSGRVYRWTREE